MKKIIERDPRTGKVSEAATKASLLGQLAVGRLQLAGAEQPRASAGVL